MSFLMNSLCLSIALLCALVNVVSSSCWVVATWHPELTCEKVKNSTICDRGWNAYGSESACCKNEFSDGKCTLLASNKRYKKYLIDWYKQLELESERREEYLKELELAKINGGGSPEFDENGDYNGNDNRNGGEIDNSCNGNSNCKKKVVDNSCNGNSNCKKNDSDSSEKKSSNNNKMLRSVCVYPNSKCDKDDDDKVCIRFKLKVCKKFKIGDKWEWAKITAKGDDLTWQRYKDKTCSKKEDGKVTAEEENCKKITYKGDTKWIKFDVLQL